MGIVITERDRTVLNFLAKWRFCTIEQLLKAEIFTTTRKRCYCRLLELCKSKLIKSCQLANETLYYHLLPQGAEVINLDIPYYSKIFKDASDSTVVQHLVHCDYALALGIDYLATEEAFQKLSLNSSYDVLKKVVKGQDKFYYQNDVLNALVVDFGLSAKYLLERATAYAKLPGDVKNNFVVVFLTFNDSKKNAIAKTVSGSGLVVRLLKSKWKY